MAPVERHIEEALYRSAVELIERRYPTGWGGAAAMRLAGKDNGKHDGSNGSEALIVTSVAIETPNAAASLCIEVGAMCEAMKLDRRFRQQSGRASVVRAAARPASRTIGLRCIHSPNWNTTSDKPPSIEIPTSLSYAVGSARKSHWYNFQV